MAGGTDDGDVDENIEHPFWEESLDSVGLDLGDDIHGEDINVDVDMDIEKKKYSGN